MKKLLAFLLAAIMVFAVVACTTPGGDNSKELAGTYKLTLWVPDAAVELTKTQVENYNKTNQNGIVIEATINNVSEADAATNMITDVENGADLYFFAQDQFARLVQARALAQLGKTAAEGVKTANSTAAVTAASSGEDIYAYPLTADNGYFMYYDKSVIPEADVDSLEKLVADCENAKKYFAFEMNTSAWYLASFFFATGCKSEWQLDEDGKFVGVDDTFNSANGLIAAKGMHKLVTSPFHLSSSKGSEFSSGAAIVVSGTWDYEAVKGILGDNLGVADLPSFEVDGTSYHLGSYNGCKLLGVKPQTDSKKLAVAHRLAQYLTTKDAQLERFEAMSWGPANVEAQASDAVKANPALVALNAQAPYSVPQGQIHGSWWDIAKVIGDDVKAATDDAGLQAALDNYKAKIDAIFKMSDDEKNAYTVIGNINGDSWSVDLPMTEVESGVWKTNEAYDMTTETQFKVRQGKAWDVAFPSENYKPEAAGKYYVQLTVTADGGEVTLIAA